MSEREYVFRPKSTSFVKSKNAWKLQPLWVEIPDWTFLFYGAMYVSYGLNVAIGIATFIISYVYLILH
jgi:hypothetical protein